MKKTKKIKILIIIGQLDIGGAELHILNIAKNIDREKYELAIFPLKKGGTLHKEFINYQISILGKNYNKLSKVAVFISLVELIFISFKYKPDIFHFFLPEAYILGSIFTSFFSRSKRIMSRRSLNVYQKKNVYKFFRLLLIEKLFHKRMKYITGNSKAVCGELIEEGIEKNKVRLIYNGIDLDKFSNKEKAYIKNSEKSELIIICIANLIPYKGHWDLISGIAKKSDKIKITWRLLLVGRDDGCKHVYQSAIRKNYRHLMNNIEFLGEVGDVAPLIKKSDIGVLCSHQEGFSNSILECMAGGLPMVVTNVGGNSEVISHGVNGLLVQPHSPEQIGDKILELINDESLRKELGKAAMKEVVESYNLSKCAKMYEKLYNDTMLDN